MLSLLCPVCIPNLPTPLPSALLPQNCKQIEVIGLSHYIYFGLVCYTAIGNQKELGIPPAYNEKKKDSMVYLKCNVIKQFNLESQHYIMMS